MGTQHRTWSALSGEDSFGNDHFRSRGFTPAPILVQWMVTQKCDLACPHCLSAPTSNLAELTTR